MATTSNIRSYTVDTSQTVVVGDLVKVSGVSSTTGAPEVTPCAAGEHPIGVVVSISDAGAAGTGVSVKSYPGDGTFKCRAAAALGTVGTVVYSAADGEVSSTAAGQPLFVTLSPASAADGMLECAAYKADTAGSVNGPVYSKTVMATAATSAHTITTAQILAGGVGGAPTTASNYVTPSAATLVAAIPGCFDGASFEFVINNKSAGSNTITVTVTDSGNTGDGTLTVAQNVIRPFRVIVTNSATGSEAVTYFGLGA